MRTDITVERRSRRLIAGLLFAVWTAGPAAGLDGLSVARASTPAPSGEPSTPERDGEKPAPARAVDEPHRAAPSPTDETGGETEGETTDEEAEDGAHRTVVSASRRNERIFRAPRHVTVVDSDRRDELGARSVPDMLEGQTGVHVQRTNRGAAAPIIRGLVGPQNLILVDGVPLNTATFRTGPNQYLSLLDPQLVRRVEVVRGPSAVAYGNGAMGGVMQVLLVEPFALGGEFEHSGTAQLRFASADMSPGGTARWSGSAGDFGWLVGANFDLHDELRTGGGTRTPASEYASAGWLAKLTWTPGSDVTVKTAYLGSTLRDAGRTDKLGLGEVRRYDNDEHLAWTRVDWAPELSWLARVGARLSYHRQDESVLRHNCARNSEGTVAERARCAAADDDVIDKKRLNIDTVDSVGAEVDAHFRLWEERIDLMTGIDVRHDSVDSRREDAKASEGFVFEPKARGNFSNGSTYLSLGMFLNASAGIWTIPDTFELRADAGLRLSHFQSHAPDVPDLGDVDYNFQGLVGSVGIQVVLPELLSVYASFMQGFRAPNLQETTVLGNTGSKFEVPNPGLRPERSDTLEVGARLDRPWLGVSATVFHSWLTDAIDEAPTTLQGVAEIDGTPVVRRVNAARGHVLGFESDVRVSFADLHLSAGLSWLEADITDADGQTTAARRVPPLQGNVTLRYEVPGEQAHIEVGVQWAAAQRRLHPSDRKDHRICETAAYSGVLQTECTGTDGFAVLSIRGGFPLGEHLRMQASLNNVLDKSYRQHGSGFLAPGMDARVSLTARY